MTDRLTDREIQDLRHYVSFCTDEPRWAIRFKGVHLHESVARLLDEIEDHRRFRKALGPVVIDEAAEPMTAEQWAKFQALMPKLKDGGA